MISYFKWWQTPNNSSDSTPKLDIRMYVSGSNDMPVKSFLNNLCAKMLVIVSWYVWTEAFVSTERQTFDSLLESCDSVDTEYPADSIPIYCDSEQLIYTNCSQPFAQWVTWPSERISYLVWMVSYSPRDVQWDWKETHFSFSERY